MGTGLSVPARRRAGLRRVLDAIADARDIVLTTHVNADGDGAGSEAALAAWLAARGKSPVVVNPTPFPDLYRYLLEDPDWVRDAGGPEADAALERADLFVVLDTAEPRRLGRVPRAFGDRPVVVMDHHPPVEPGIPAVAAVQDTTACATGELVYDLLTLAGDEPWPPAVAEGLYAAIVTDTGSFRFSNTTPRTHALAGDLLRRGVDPEEVYRRIFGTVPLRRIHLLRAALEYLETDPDLPITWISIPRSAMRDTGAASEDLDGLIEYARSIEGTEVALLFRETNGSTKVSFRSNGAVDVNALARQFGGGGHVKAAGALVGGPLHGVRSQVLEATRAALRALEEPRHERYHQI